jgi:hypothetical protein
MLQVVDVTAQSVFGSLQFGSWRSSDPPSEVDPILKFEVKEKHLKGCDCKSTVHSSMYTMR